MTVVSDLIASTFNRSGATLAVVLDLSKAFDRLWLSGLLDNLKSSRISAWFFWQVIFWVVGFVFLF